MVFEELKETNVLRVHTTEPGEPGTVVRKLGVLPVAAATVDVPTVAVTLAASVASLLGLKDVVAVFVVPPFVELEAPMDGRPPVYVAAQ